MLDYSGELLYGLRKMGRGDVLDRLRGITCDPHLRKYVEWLGTMWGHAVASSTPLPDLKLHMRAWQQHFAAVYGWDALARVRGLLAAGDAPAQPSRRRLRVRQGAARSAATSGCWCRSTPSRRWKATAWTTSTCRTAWSPATPCGEEVSIIAIIKTQGSDTKLVAQMQPYYEAKGLQRAATSAASASRRIVTQIGDGENGGVMMNEFPSGYRQAIRQFGTEGVVDVNVTEYLELIEQAGVTRAMLPALPADPPGQGLRAHHEVGAGRRRQGHRGDQEGEAAASAWKAARGPTTSAGCRATRTC